MKKLYGILNKIGDIVGEGDHGGMDLSWKIKGFMINIIKAGLNSCFYYMYFSISDHALSV